MKFISYLVVVFFLIVSFKKNEVQNINPYISNFIVSASEVNNKIVLNVKSVRFFSTTGYGITYCVEVRNNEIYIKFIKINAPEVGCTTFAPATCKIDLGKLEHGKYKITFEHNKKKTNGKLIVGSTVELMIVSGSNVKAK